MRRDRAKVSFDKHTDAVYCVAFSPDSHEAVSGGNDAVLRVWNVDTGQELLALRGSPSPVTSVAFSPDGSLLAAAHADGVLSLWRAYPNPPAP